MLLKMYSFHEGEVMFRMYLGNAYAFATITGFVVCFGYVSKTFTLKQLTVTYRRQNCLKV